MKRPLIVFVVLTAAVAACVALEREALKPVDTHYSAAFIDGRTLSIFPFDGKSVARELPVSLGAMTFAATGTTVYGTVPTQPGMLPRLVGVSVGSWSQLPVVGSEEFMAVNGLAITNTGDRAVVSGRRRGASAEMCGLYELDLITGRIERVVENLGGGCDFLSSWSNLSFSRDGVRVLGTAKKGQIGIVNLGEHRIEKLFPGTAASYSPDGKWIAAVNFAAPMKIELIDSTTFAKVRDLGSEETGRLEWSPDSRFLLVWKSELSCGFGAGYFGTLQTLDIQTGQRSWISSSRCRVNRMTTGWVSDEALK